MPIGGGSGGANDVRGGGAFFEVYARDSLTKDLEKILSKAKAETGKAMSGLGGGGLGGAKNIAKGMGLFALVDAAVEKLSKPLMMVQDHISDWASGAREVNKEFTALQARIDEIGAAAGRGRADFMERLSGQDTIRGKGIPEKERAKAGESELQTQRQMLARQNKEMKLAAEQQEHLANGFWPKTKEAVGGLIPGVGDAVKKDMEQQRRAAEANLENLKRQKSATEDFIRDLEKQVFLMKKAEKEAKGKTWSKWTDDVEGFRKDMQFEIDTLGKTPEEAHIFRLEMEAASKGIENVNVQLEQTKATMKELADKKLFKELDEGFKDLTKNAEWELRTMGMTPEQKALAEMKRKNTKVNPVTGIEEEIFGGLDKKDPNTAGLLAMLEDAKKMEGLDEFKKKQAEAAMKNAGFGNSVKGSFSADGRSLGIGDSFQRVIPDKLTETNKWLAQMFGVMKQDIGPLKPNLPADLLKTPAPGLNIPDIGRGIQFNMPGIQRQAVPMPPGGGMRDNKIGAKTNDLLEDILGAVRENRPSAMKFG